MSSAFVSKSRRVRFELNLTIIDLNNVPLVSGSSFVKWHLPSSTAAEHRGSTEKRLIKDHRVLYDYERVLPVRLTVAKDGMLQECGIDLEVLQEYSAGGRGERIVLGHVKLNLAEYVEASEGGSNSPGPEKGADGTGVVRRYLMQESKINSTLKIGISMRYIEGARDYYAPPLRTAPVFGGIAGIVPSSDPVLSHASSGDGGADGGSDDLAMPSLSTTNRETGEMQDMYRRTLAAFWASQPGELKADECIEDIFAGGDGWGKGGRPTTHAVGIGHHTPSSGPSTPNPDREDIHAQGDSRSSKIGNARRGFFDIGKSGKHGNKAKLPRKAAGEVDEFEIREDLRSWNVGQTAY